jgi:tetratricopeptide (TPR) repeat protein
MTHARPGLQGDPRRRASNVVRGFDYQFWRTVEVWIELGAEEVLYVEGAEDFDLVGEVEATAVQVKDDRASGPLTLNGAKALGALGNFWTLTNANRGRAIRFLFITTAEAGSEGKFDGRKGVELWNLCGRSPLAVCMNDVTRIRDFLVRKKSLDRRLAKFLKDAPVAEVFRELIQPLEWLFDQPALETVQETVVGKLLELGRPRGLTLSDAGHLANTLYRAVVAAAVSEKPQRLTLIDFTERLDRAANVEIPRELLRRRGVLASDAVRQLFANAADAPAADFSILTGTQEAFAPPVLNKTPLPRRNLVERVRTALASGIAFVTGGAGTGKTTLVRQAIEGRAPLLWAGLRGKTVSDIVAVCRDISQRIATGQAPTTVILDDLNPEGDPRLLEDLLGRLAAAVGARRAALAIIAYRPVGPRLSSILGLAGASHVSMPAFEEEEIQQFLIVEGCPASRAAELTRIVQMQTGGHPQLVAARIEALKAASFPELALTDILDQPQEIHDARAEALHVARSALPEAARNLLYRLSLAIPELKRSHALRIAAAKPPIPQPGDMFDHLLGAWLEQPVPGRYRVSALVSRAGEEMLAPQEVTQVHADIAAALLAERQLTPSEFAGIVFHALTGRAEAQLAIAAQMFMTAPREVKESLGQELSPIAAAGVGEGTHLPIASKPVRQFFRLLQWEVAGLAAPRYLDPLARLMESEFAAEGDDIAEVLPRILYLTKLLLEIDFPISPDRVVRHTLELRRLSESANARGLSVGAGIPPLHPGLSRSIFADLFAAALIPRLRTVDDLRALVRAMDLLSSEDRERLLDGFHTDDGELRVLFLSPWAGMRRGAEGSYDDYARAVEDALAAGRRWHHKPWMRAAARTLSAILDEMLQQSAKAEEVVKATAQEVGWSPNLEDQLALIAFNRNEDAKALEMWQRILPEWRSERLVHDMQPLLSTRCAAIAAAHLQRWDVAADFFRQAIDSPAGVGLRPWRVGLEADRGYALWRSGSRKEAVAAFAEVVKTLETLPNRPESFAEYAVQKLAVHVLAFLADRGGPLATPFPGMCSNLSPSEEIKQLPPTPTVCAWYFLYHLAREAGDDDCAVACVNRVRNAPFAFVRGMAARDTLERRLQSHDLRGVLGLATTTALEMSKAIQRRDAPPYEPDAPDLSAELTEDLMAAFVRPGLCAAIIRAKVIGLSIDALVDDCRNDVDPAQPYVSHEVVSLAVLSRMGGGELASVLRNEDEVSERRIFASAFLLGREDTLPDDVLYAQLIVSDVARVRELMRDVSGPSFDELVRGDWLRFCANPFMLRSPQVYVPAIRQACEDSVVGWSAAARIILAAAPATRLNFSDEMRRRLREVANQSGGH